MMTVTIHEAKTNLSKLIAAVLAGEDVVVARGKEPVVRLVAVNPVPTKKRELGWLAHTVPEGVTDILGHGFWDPLSADELASWNGEAYDPNDEIAA